MHYGVWKPFNGYSLSFQSCSIKACMWELWTCKVSGFITWQFSKLLIQCNVCHQLHGSPQKGKVGDNYITP
jgi:hypothetical protein